MLTLEAVSGLDEQPEIKALMSVALAPMTAKVTDCSYAVPAGQLQGVTEVEEHGGREVASAAGATRAKAVRSAGNFIVK